MERDKNGQVPEENSRYAFGYESPGGNYCVNCGQEIADGSLVCKKCANGEKPSENKTYEGVLTRMFDFAHLDMIRLARRTLRHEIAQSVVDSLSGVFDRIETRHENADFKVSICQDVPGICKVRVQFKVIKADGEHDITKEIEIPEDIIRRGGFDPEELAGQIGLEDTK
ncbi:MAG: hypothetical protein K5768_10615 [Firmicutes bacterium]|nr:hypothetical protein [Bacillota bacterium]